MYERYCALRDSKNVKDADVSRNTGIPKSTFSDWKSGKSSPKQDKLKKIADFLGVTVDFLMGKDNRIQCKECGQVYNPIDESEKEMHDAYHQKCIIAKEKYPFLIDANYESGLAECYEFENFKNQSLSDEERINAFSKYLEAKFTSYLSRRGFEIDGINYEDFCKSEISMLEPDGSISEKLITKVAKKYNVDITMMDMNSRLLARASKNQQLMRILAYAERLYPEMLDAIEIQLKALADQEPKE